MHKKEERQNKNVRDGGGWCMEEKGQAGLMLQQEKKIIWIDSH